MREVHCDRYVTCAPWTGIKSEMSPQMAIKCGEAILKLKARMATQILANSLPYLLITFERHRERNEGPTKKLYGIWRK